MINFKTFQQRDHTFKTYLCEGRRVLILRRFGIRGRRGPYSLRRPFHTKNTPPCLFYEYKGGFMIFSLKIAKEGSYKIGESKCIRKLPKMLFHSIWSSNNVLIMYDKTCSQLSWVQSQNGNWEWFFQTLIKLRLKTTEVAVSRCSSKKVLLKISQYSQENTWVGVSRGEGVNEFRWNQIRGKGVGSGSQLSKGTSQTYGPKWCLQVAKKYTYHSLILINE